MVRFKILILLLALSSSAMGDVSLVKNEKVEVRFSAAVSSFFVYNDNVDDDKYNTTRIRSGFNPSKLAFDIMTPSWNEYEVKSRIALYPSVQNDNKKASDPALQLRETYVVLKADNHSFLFGRSLSLFQRQQVIFDMSALGLGATGEYSPGNSTTAGMIAHGYLYPNFNSGVVLNYVFDNKVDFSLGLYDPSDIGEDENYVESPRVESEIVYTGFQFKNIKTKIYASTLYQSSRLAVAKTNKSIGSHVSAHGVSAGSIFEFKTYKAGFSLYSGQALGLDGNLSGEDSLKSSGDENYSRGRHFQIVKKFNDYDFGVSFGQSEVNEKTNTGLQFLGVFHANEYIKFNAELGRFKNEQDSLDDIEYNSISFGITLSM